MIHPTEVRGKFRKWRKRLGALLGLFFLVLPWIRVNGNQAFLFDIPGRKFSIFGFLFWGHDVPLLLFAAGGFILGVTLITSVFGRVWCGWACPQTIFIDFVFREIEKWIEGDAVSRRRLDLEPLTFDGFLKKSIKWTAFGVVASVISHSLLAYFVGTERLFSMVTDSPVHHPVTFILMIGILGFVLFNFGWFRERFCTHVCPYGRFQTVLLDEKSWTVAYDSRRGEKRKGSVRTGEPNGDCIDCGKCIAVCPTGIDIRNGLQLECISCTACMDACDSVMQKLRRPEGLIRYEPSLPSNLYHRMGVSLFRTRPLIYLSALLALGFSLFLVLQRREPLDFVVIRAVGSPYEVIRNDGEFSEIVNHFNIDLHNLTFDAREIQIELLDPVKGTRFITSEFPSVIQGGEQRRLSAFLEFPKNILEYGKANVKLRLKSQDRKTGLFSVHDEEVRVVGPY